MNEIYPINEPLDLDTLVQHIKVSYSVENWNDVISISNELLELAKEIHKELLEKGSTSHVFGKHIIYYFGYSYLMTGLSYQKLGVYTKSKEYISLYANLDWLDDSSETGKLIIQDFKFFASANSLQIDVLDGKQEKIAEYVEFLDNNPDQVLPGMINILRSANHFNYNVDSEISQLSKHIDDYTQYTEKIKSAYYLSYHYQLALYRHKREEHESAIDITLHVLVAADRLGNDKYFKKAISLFEILRKFGKTSQLKTCYDILNDIIMRGDLLNEKDHTFTNDHTGSVSFYNLS
ncbi:MULTISPECIES: hypothetical protein [unclassified Paenibacillus]|uniref:DNA-binding protein n=1 Tax=Paenibacillus provencensis TaxID=441151 RepID=A0ABW3PQ71_9BACL|nr:MULTISPECIES: hypothetical protein [unclassified Paenibacillus]MCM3126500.1 hypothetical protein [Paenibacillus sp. MER 78]SFS59754.1 hypothetical protein SAMN04488601_1012336 [Paenibacillus sp. 453mf]